MSSDDEWCWISCLQCSFFVKESVLGGDVYFGGCFPHGCLLGCLFSGVPVVGTLYSLWFRFRELLVFLSPSRRRIKFVVSKKKKSILSPS